MQRPEKRVRCLAVLMFLLHALPWEESWVVFFLCVCVIVYVFCTVPWEESGLFLCDSVCVVYSAVEREWGVFV